jgi:dihydropyrimidinase
MAFLIKNGIIGDSNRSFRGDVLVEGDKIAAVGESIECDGVCVVDASGKYVLPGGVDPHTHVTLRSDCAAVSDGFEAATRAALWGGTTTIAEHPAFAPVGSPLSFAVDNVISAAGSSYADFGVHMVFQRHDEGVEREAGALVEAGFPTGKIYTTYDGMLADEEIFGLMQAMNLCGGLLFFHAENNAIARGLANKFRKEGAVSPASWPKSRPDYCEAEAVGRILALARGAGSPSYIVHLSTALGLKEIIEARRVGQTVYAETCPQYLCLTDERYGRNDGIDCVMAPPLRKGSDCDALWKAIGSGWIDTVGTDHCSFSRADKMRLGGDDVFRCPGGVPGIETRMPIMFSEGFLKGRISLEQMVGVTSANPARILGMPRKGRIAPGFDADIAVFDPSAEAVLSEGTLHQRVDYTPYEGMRVRGLPSCVWLRGRPVIADGRFVADEPFGRLIKRRF